MMKAPAEVGIEEVEVKDTENQPDRNDSSNTSKDTREWY